MYNTCSNYMQNYVYDNYCVHWCTLVHIMCTRYIHIYHIWYIFDVHYVQ